MNFTFDKYGDWIVLLMGKQFYLRLVSYWDLKCCINGSV